MRKSISKFGEQFALKKDWIITMTRIFLKFLILLGLICYMAIHPVFAQDSEPDSTKIYKEIETYSERHKFTSLLFGLIFNPVASDQTDEISPKGMEQKNYYQYDGKIIRDIKIESLDPFGYALYDTLAQPDNFLAKAGNALHVTTLAMTIRNLILIRENQVFDSYLVSESERLLRSMSYITDVLLRVEHVAGGSDSVDIYIRELDRWSIIPGGSFSGKRLNARLRDDNFLGMGHEFSNGLTWNHTTGRYAYRGKYHVPNIRNTYINTTLQYGTDEHGNFIKSAAVDRPFYSTFTRWAGGFNISQHLRTDSLWATNYMKFKYNSQDYWLGHAARLYPGNSIFQRSTNLITSARFSRTRYLQKPDESIDTLRFYSDENLYLALVGVSTRMYVQDRYVFKFGLTEDVPVGQTAGIVGGFQQRNNTERFYLAAFFSSGRYYSFGYLSTGIEYGTFFNSSKVDQGVMNVGIDFYTNLMELGRWKFRQFIKPRATFGFARAGYDSLTINDQYGISGFYSSVLSGTNRLLLTSQTQFYAPWNIWGFRFGPYMTISLGMLGNETSGFKKSNVYSLFGIGFLVKNDNLVMNTFQFSFSFYPTIPGKGNNFLRLNTFQTTDFGFRDFGIGKPEKVVFR
jgi:hypothetical protein